jgi:nucleoid-associated protein YgaU
VLAGSKKSNVCSNRTDDAEGNAMLTVENDWIEYEAVPARRVAVRGGAACAQRLPVAAQRPVLTPVRAVPDRPAVRPVPARPAGRAAGRAAKPAPLRLTRRGRVVLIVLPSLLALSGALLAAAPGTAEAAAPVVRQTVVVGTGDTLWTIAERIAPGTDPRITVAALERANDLSGAMIQAGAVLVLPQQR